MGQLHVLSGGGRAEQQASHRAGDGPLQVRARDQVFAGAPRGPVTPLARRMRPSVDSVTSLRGLQVVGVLSMTALCWWIGVRGVLEDGGGVVPGACLALGMLLPLAAKVLVEAQVRVEFWRQWAATRGMESAVGAAAAEPLPAGLDRCPLMGPTEERIIELVATRELCGRAAFVGSLARLTRAPEDERFATPWIHRATFVLLPVPPAVAARWRGVSIRADHGARRPLVQRAMVGSLVPGVVAEGRAHLAVADGQDVATLHRLVDARLDAWLAEHPLDADLVGELLVVTRDGAPVECEALEELCREALLLHELVVADHELPTASAVPEPVAATPEPVVDLSREGWGQGSPQYYEAA